MRFNFILLCLLAFGGFLTLAVLAWEPEKFSVSTCLPYFLLLGLPSLIVAIKLPSWNNKEAPIKVILVVALLLRLMWFGHDALLSNDYYRYLWDGRVQIAGHMPYGVAPQDPLLDGVEADYTEDQKVRDLVNHPEVPTIYPPLMQIYFWAFAKLGWQFTFWRILLLAAEALLVWAMVMALDHLRKDSRLVVLYCWHPLAIFENSWSAHTEIIAVALFFAACVLLLRSTPGNKKQIHWAAACFAWGAAAKILPLALFPFLLRRYGWKVIVTAVVAVIIPMLPYYQVDVKQATAGLFAYAEQWYFNDICYRPLGYMLGLDPQDRTLASTQILRYSMIGTWGAICLFLAWRVKNPLKVGLVATGAFVFLAATLHPWYLLWVLPFAIVLGSRSMLLLSYTVLMSYLVLVGWRQHGVWQELDLLRYLEFVPVLMLLVWEVYRLAFARPKKNRRVAH